MKEFRIFGIKTEEISKIIRYLKAEHYLINYKMIPITDMKNLVGKYKLEIVFIYEEDYNRFCLEIGGNFKRFCKEFFSWCFTS